MDEEEPVDFSGKVAKGSLWGFAGNFGSKLLSFVYLILLARAATQEDIGLFYLSYSMVGILMVASELGLPSSLQRYIPFYDAKGERGKAAALLRASYLIVCASSVLFMAALFAGADGIAAAYQNPGLAPALRLIVPFIIVGSLFRVHAFFLQGSADMRGMQTMMGAQNALKLGLTALLLWLSVPGLLAISAAFTLSHLLALIVWTPLVMKDARALGKPVSLASGEVLREIIPFGVMLSVLASFATILASADKLVLGYLSVPEGASELVAIYTIGSSLAIMLTLIPYSIELIFLPVISRLVGKGDMKGVRSLTAAAQGWSLLLTLPAAIALMVFSGDVLGALYGESYRSGGAAMTILALAFAIKTYSHILSVTLAAMRLVRLEIAVYAVSAALNVGLGIALVPLYGMEGAAAATLASMALMAALFAFYSKKSFGFTFPARVWRISAAGAITLAAAYAAHGPLSSLLLSAPAGADALAEYAGKFAYLAFFAIVCLAILALFGVLCITLRCLRREDADLLGRALRKAGAPPLLSNLALKAALLGTEA
ncbi:MAG: oligosaccharide flippase family protein [Candidatus Micrarchaeota archaeon]